MTLSTWEQAFVFELLFDWLHRFFKSLARSNKKRTLRKQFGALPQVFPCSACPRSQDRRLENVRNVIHADHLRTAIDKGLAMEATTWMGSRGVSRAELGRFFLGEMVILRWFDATGLLSACLQFLLLLYHISTFQSRALYMGDLYPNRSVKVQTFVSKSSIVLQLLGKSNVFFAYQPAGRPHPLSLSSMKWMKCMHQPCAHRQRDASARIVCYLSGKGIFLGGLEETQPAQT